MKGKSWETEIAERFVKECANDPEWNEFIDNWINDKDYVYPFEKPAKVVRFQKSENAATKVLNQYWVTIYLLTPNKALNLLN
jgi:hypothetical protein